MLRQLELGVFQIIGLEAGPSAQAQGLPGINVRDAMLPRKSGDQRHAALEALHGENHLSIADLTQKIGEQYRKTKRGSTCSFTILVGFYCSISLGVAAVMYSMGSSLLNIIE